MIDKPVAPRPLTRGEIVTLTALVTAVASAIPLGPILAFEFDEPMFCVTVFLLAFFLV